MAKIQLLICFTILFASITLLDVVSAHLKTKPALPQIEDPKTLKDVEPYTVNVVMVFVSDLEKECPKTNKFKAFFEKLRGFAKYVCPIRRSDEKDYDKDMKAKAGGLLQAISSFAVGKIKEEIQEEKMEAIANIKWMKSVVGKILGGRKKDESEESMNLTAEQLKEIKEGILKWETVIAKITNTMVLSTTNSGSESSFKDTTGSSSHMGSPSGSPSSSPSGSRGSETTTSSTQTENASANQKTAITVTQVEAETSKEVMTFLMNLEKKCPQKEEYKAFFEQLKGTMTVAPSEASPKARKGFFSRIKSAAGKLSDAMAFMRSRIGTKSAEVKKSLETYQGEVMKAVQELDAIHSQIVSQNKEKKDGSLTCTAEQQKEIKLTITKWEQVTTQFVETAIQSETQSSSTTSSSSQGKDKLT